MKKTIALGVSLILGIELLALTAQDRQFVLAASGVALAVVLFEIRWALGARREPGDGSESEDLGGALRRWVASTETTIQFADSTRSDWDRHLRPMLARRFEIATGQRLSKDPVAFHASGRMLFGSELWEWVNPNNVAPTRDGSPGPGRGALEAILRRMEQV